MAATAGQRRAEPGGRGGGGCHAKRLIPRGLAAVGRCHAWQRRPGTTHLICTIWSGSGCPMEDQLDRRWKAVLCFADQQGDCRLPDAQAGMGNSIQAVCYRLLFFASSCESTSLSKLLLYHICLPCSELRTFIFQHVLCLATSISRAIKVRAHHCAIFLNTCTIWNHLPCLIA